MRNLVRATRQRELVQEAGKLAFMALFACK